MVALVQVGQPWHVGQEIPSPHRGTIRGEPEPPVCSSRLAQPVCHVVFSWDMWWLTPY